jgi:hypothetical protein
MFQQVLLKALVDEMRSSVTYDYHWNSESWKYYFFEHPFGAHIVCFIAWQSFDPF